MDAPWAYVFWILLRIQGLLLRPGTLRPFPPGSSQNSLCSDWLCYVSTVARPHQASCQDDPGLQLPDQPAPGVGHRISPGTRPTKQSAMQIPLPPPPVPASPPKNHRHQTCSVLRSRLSAAEQRGLTLPSEGEAPSWGWGGPAPGPSRDKDALLPTRGPPQQPGAAQPVPHHS